MDEHIKRIREEFTKQADNFNEYQKNFSKEEYNKFVVENMQLKGNENVLEVAAGTCAFGRSVAPYVANIVELDATEAMLTIGEQEGKRIGIKNATYQIGLAEKLPFEDENFDIVMSRLAFHHFEDVDIVFKEMNRVLKKGGKLVILDMEAREEALRKTADYYETLRDQSHVKCISQKEFEILADQNGFIIEYSKINFIPIKLTSWMELTNVPEDKKIVISSAMLEDIEGGTKTGFEPYEQDGQIMFNHRWFQMIARKQ